MSGIKPLPRLYERVWHPVVKYNNLYDFATGMALATVGTKKIPAITGVGFSSSVKYSCKYYSANTKSSTHILPVTSQHDGWHAHTCFM